MKICSKCGEEKPLSEFGKHKQSKGGYYNQCKKCRKRWYETNKGIIKEKRVVYTENNKEKIAKKMKEYYDINKEKINDKSKKYNLEWYEINKVRIAEVTKKYQQNNKEKITQRFLKRRKTDPLFKLSGNLRNRIRIAYQRKNWQNDSNNYKLLGCDYKTAFEHLEKQFINGMSWDNQGEWHIDHIIPLASANTVEELQVLCHYTNLQPLWAFDNMSKGSKIFHIAI